MADYSLTVYHLFDDLLNLCADNGNISVLQKRCAARQIDVSVKTLRAGDIPDFSDADIVIFGGGSCYDRLQVSKQADIFSKPLKDYVENNGVMLATCSGYQLLGNYFEYNGEKIPAFKILDIETTVSDKKFMGDIVAEAELNGKKITLAGFENHTEKTNIKSQKPLGKVLYGFGNDGSGEFEGVCYKNVVATYLHGPTLPRNPELADFLIESALKRKYSDFSGSLAQLNDEYEMCAKQFIIDRNQKQKGNKKNDRNHRLQGR